MKVNKKRDNQADNELSYYTDAPVMEAYRILRTNIEFSSSVQKTQVLLITSSLQGEGKSTTVANLARAFAYAGTKTLIIDLDLRRPVQHKIHSIGETIGISEVIVGKASCEEAIHTTDMEKLHLLPCGYRPPNPAEMLSTSKLTEIITSLREQYDMIIIDTPPINLLADAAILTKSADASILIVSAGHTEMDDMRMALDILQRSGTRLLGTVLNKATRQSSSYKYRYYSYDY